ncbi:hypothetical protein J6590_087684 [Homalodisca vitripennis]|nr:hypothetical protein J6590_087684 [Homalodisca vitripennis]
MSGAVIYPQLLTYEHYSLGINISHMLGTHLGIVVKGPATGCTLSSLPLMAVGPRAATGRDGGDDDDIQEAVRRDTNGPGLGSDAG